MKKLLIAFLISAVTLTGCSLLGPTPKDKVSDAYKNMEAADYTSFEFLIDGEMTAEGETVGMIVRYSGDQDMSDKTKPKFTMAIDMELTVPEIGAQSVGGEIRTDGELLYFVLNNITDFGGELPMEMVSPFVNKWYSLDISGGELGQLSPLSGMSMGDEENMTEEQKELMELYEKTEFLKDVELLRSEGGMDIYSAKIDKEAAREFIVAAVEMQGQALTGTETEEVKSLLESLEVNLEVYVDPAKELVTKTTGVVAFDDPEMLSGEFDFDMTFSNIGTPVTIEIPTDVEVFDPMMLFGAMMGMDPATMEMMMEESAVMDDSMMLDPIDTVPGTPAVESDTNPIEFMSPEDAEEFTKEMEKAFEDMEAAMGDLEMEF